MKHSVLFLLLLCALCSNACLDDVQQRPPSSDASPDSNDEKEDSDMTDISSCTDLGKEDIYVDAGASDAPEKCQNMDQTEGTMSCTKNAPCKTLAKGVETLSAERSHIHVMPGTYLEASTIVLNKEFEVTITGEIDDTSQPSTNENVWPVITLGVNTTMFDTTMDIVGSGNHSVTLENLTIKGPDLSSLMSAGSQEHGRIAYTLKAANFQPNTPLMLNNIEIMGGIGGLGPNGTIPTDLPQDGGDALGTEGGTPSAVGMKGYSGGLGGDCTEGDSNSPGRGNGKHGENDDNATSANGGIGQCSLADLDEPCGTRGGEIEGNGDPGISGMNGTNAVPGSITDELGEFLYTGSEFKWIAPKHEPTERTAATPGKPGEGGGGGGGSASRSANTGTAHAAPGINGGGGGGGGSAGTSATHGKTGGASIAVSLNNVALEGSANISYGRGGDGGNGGDALKGGAGGKGFEPAEAECMEGEAIPGNGGKGGDGGDGGNGAPGYGGCPGPIIGVLTNNDMTNNTLNIPSTSPTPGNMGEHGGVKDGNSVSNTTLTGDCSPQIKDVLVASPDVVSN